jgi:HSP20 family protein
MAKAESREIVKTEPTKAPSRLEEMERWFEDAFRRPYSLFAPSGWPRLRMHEMEMIAPIVDIFEDHGDVVVKAQLPGMKKEDIDVKLTDGTIIISGEKKQGEKVEKKDYYRMESSYGSFTRTINLPSEVQTDKAKAKFKDGVLEIRAPMTDEAKKKEKKLPIE